MKDTPAQSCSAMRAGALQCAMRLRPYLSRFLLSLALLMNGFALPSGEVHATVADDDAQASLQTMHPQPMAPCHQLASEPTDSTSDGVPNSPESHEDKKSETGQGCCSSGCACACVNSVHGLTLETLAIAAVSLFRVPCFPNTARYFPPHIGHLTRPPIA